MTQKVLVAEFPVKTPLTTVPFVAFYDPKDPKKTPVYAPGPGLQWINIKAQADLTTGALTTNKRRAFIYVPAWIFGSQTVEAPIGDGPILAVGQTVSSDCKNSNGTGNASSKATGPNDWIGAHTVLNGLTIGTLEHVFLTCDPDALWLVGDRATATLVFDEVAAPS